MREPSLRAYLTPWRCPERSGGSWFGSLFTGSPRRLNPTCESRCGDRCDEGKGLLYTVDAVDTKDTSKGEPPSPDPVEPIQSFDEFNVQWDRSIHLTHFSDVIQAAISSYEAFSSFVDETRAAAEEQIALHIPMQALLAGYELRTAARLRREFVGRSIYVVAWTAFEDLFTSCLRFVLQKQPALLLARLARDQSKPGHGPVYGALKRILEEGWERDQVINELIETELATLPLDQGMDRLPAYLKKLDVEVEPDMMTILGYVKKQRNRAAHNATFVPPQVEDARSDLERFAKAGQHIALTIAQRHKIDVM